MGLLELKDLPPWPAKQYSFVRHLLASSSSKPSVALYVDNGDCSRGKEVVVKTSPLASDDVPKDAFKDVFKEVEILFFLSELATVRSCPTIIQPLAAYRDDEQLRFVQEFAAGGELFDHLQQHGSLRVPEALRVASQLLHGVSVLHDAGVAHLDISPENLLWHVDGSLRLVDFEGAVFTHCKDTGEPIRHRMPAIGIATCRPPECFEPFEDGYFAKPVDVYQCGIVLFTMLVGSYPWDAAWQYDDAHAYVRQYGLQNLLICRDKSHIPKKLISFMEHLLANDPADRPDARSALKALLLILEVSNEVCRNTSSDSRVAGA